MKQLQKLVAICCLSLICFIIITSFIGRHSIEPSRQDFVTAGKNIACAVPADPAIVSATFAPALYAPNAVMIRKNIYNFTAVEITSLKNGIAAMKALPLNNTSSWQYQAAIHGTTLGNNLPLWNSCQHGTQFFFSWHRMYLYFFERILRFRSGDPNLTLPYWDYQSNPALPADYRNSAAGNPLYDGSRYGSINGGGSLPASIMTSLNNSLNDLSFYNFQSDIEGPHGTVHTSIGGNMHNVPTAALDPCFWLHHTNIDRLWEVWLRKCGGRSNPTDDNVWMKKSYTFYDEKGATINMTGSQVVSTAVSLNYRYDLPLKLPCDFKLKWWVWQWKWWELLRIPNPVIINKQLVKTSFRNVPADALKRFIAETKAEKFTFSSTGISDRLFVQLENIKVEKAPEGVIEVYLNLKTGETPNPQSRSFAGVVDLFTASSHKMANHATGAAAPVRINISTAVQNLGLRPSDLSTAELTFYVRGNTVKNKEIKTEAIVQASAIVIGVDKAVSQ